MKVEVGAIEKSGHLAVAEAGPELERGGGWTEEMVVMSVMMAAEVTN